MKENTDGVDHEPYFTEQTAAVLERVKRFDNKPYLECGGKLLHDYHASRVLPGHDPKVKMGLLREVKDSSIG